MNPFLESLSYEDQLMIAMCRLSFGKEEKEYINELVSKVTVWDQFVSRVNKHGISALICNNLKELKLTDRLPVKEAAFLYTAYLKSLSRNTYLNEKLQEVKKHLAEINIEAVLLKGMALELTAYGNMGLRQMNDIDLYIERKDCLKAWYHLIGKGYRPQTLKSPLHKKIILDIGKHLPELHSDGISIELHHRLFDSVSRSPFAVSRNSILIDGLKYSMLPLEYHYLFLVKHLTYHETEKGESQLRLYNDLCQLMTQCTRDIESSGILELAKQQGLTDVLIEKFYILNLLWGMPLPEDLLKSLSDQQKHTTQEKIISFIQKPKGHKITGKGRAYRKRLKQIPGFSNKLRFITGDIFPSINFMRERYKLDSSLLASLFYTLRLAKLSLLLLP